ncbi:MAG: hypothetical protein AAGK93_03105, partial [Pseudomonadota bacterium]
DDRCGCHDPSGRRRLDNPRTCIDGIRIDHHLLSPQAADRLEGVEIFRKARGLDKPSDHVPVIATLRD